MFDFILFKPIGKIANYDLEFLEVGTLPKDVFASCSDLQKGRSIVKKVKYLHYQLYTPEQGFLKLMAQNNCCLVVGLSDFFGIPPHEVVRRLISARILVRIAKKVGVSVRIFSLARNKNEIRDSNEIFWIGKFLGLDEAQLREGRDETVSW